MSKQTVSKDTKIMELLTMDPNMEAILLREGLHCVGCSAAGQETIGEAAVVHDMTESQIEDLIGRLNDYLAVF